MFEKVRMNSFGYYELREKPSEEEVKKYYTQLYYQETKGSYEKNYSNEELSYFKNKLEQKYLLVKEALGFENVDDFKFLDIGCGEGWSLDYFKKLNWQVQGIDFSTYACEQFNPEMQDNLLVGDTFVIMDELIQKKYKYDCIYMLNVLEHVLEPENLLKKVYQLLSDVGVLLIQVPNDFSQLQRHLYNTKKIDRNFWVCSPDHISYFNAHGLSNLCHHIGFQESFRLGDFPIDLNLFNSSTNYIMDNSKGKNCHIARVEIENYLHNISPEKANQLYRILAEMGLGREIIALFRK